MSTTKSQKSNTEIHYQCNKCKDTGLIILDQDTAKSCDCKKRIAKKKRMSKILEFADIPKDFKNLKIEDFDISLYSKDNQEIADNVKEVADRFVKTYEQNTMGKGLYFYSNTKGSGKTRMALSIANEIAYRYEASIKYMTVHQLTTSIQSTFKDKNNTGEAIEDSLIEVDFLILDDLAVENTTQWSEAILYNIIDKRNDLKKLTIFTANIPINELPYREGRIQSRINRMTIEIPFPEESIRDQIACNENDEFLKLLFN